MGDHAEAIAEFEKSRDLFAARGDEMEAAVAEVWAAQFLPDVGKVAEARRRLEALIALSEKRSFKVLLPTAFYWLGVGEYYQTGLSRTGRNFRTALKLAESSANVYETHHAREALALYHSSLGELEPALAIVSRMLPGRDAYYQNPRQAWRDKRAFADLSLRLELFSTALSFSREAIALARDESAAGGRFNSNMLNSNLLSLVNASAAKGDFAAALRYADESRQLTSGRGESAENTRSLAELHQRLGEVRSQMSDCEGALADFDAALELYGRLPEFTVNAYPIHKGRLLCFRQLGRRDEFARELKKVLELSEEYRATIREDESRRAFFASEQGVFDEAAGDAVGRGDARGAFAFVEASRARSLLDFFESDKAIADVEREFGAVARSLAAEEIQSRLPEGVQVVQYAALPDRLAVWVVTRTRFDFFERAVAARELESKVEDYQTLVVGRGPAADVERGARELYELLIPPGLERGKSVCVIADKSLHGLAFASLVSPEGKYLLEEFPLLHAPSASVLVLATESARRKGVNAGEGVLSVGNPEFDREENPNLADLRAAGEEARAVAALYPKSVELVGGAATREEFLRRFTEAEVIHFAGHFVANRRAPGNSKLLFAGGDLRSSELGPFKLPLAKLVVLSACETGFERYDRSEGAIGAARTFLALGAPVVVASAWKVDSETTKDLMIAFHRGRRSDGLGAAESLRRAQLEVMRADRTKAPFYWAAFSLYGGHADY